MFNSDKPIVLVVDDSPDSLGMINSALNSAGFTVLVALNATQALSIVDQIQPSVILMDAIMPGIDGFECCKLVRIKLPLTPIIFMTGLTEVEHTVKAFEYGGNDYVTKPVKCEEVIARIRSHISNAKLIDNARGALDATKQFIFSVDNAGKIKWSTPETNSLFIEKNIIIESGCPTLEENIASWIENPLSDLHIPTEKPLTIRYVKQVNDQEHLLKVIENKNKMDHGTLQSSFPITNREAEVLLWIAHGKTNREIADILSLSPRTVNKHLEQIFTKIQVDNRTAAASIAMQSLLGESV